MIDKGKSTIQEKNKSITLKAEESGKIDVEEEMNLIARKMKRLYKTFRKYKKDIQVKDYSKRKEGTEIVCYKCKELGHIRTQCPKLKKNKKDRVMMVCTWSDFDTSSVDDDDQKNEGKKVYEEGKMAFVCSKEAKKDENINKEITQVVILDNSNYKELHNAFEDLLIEYKTLAKKYEKQKRDFELKNVGIHVF